MALTPIQQVKLQVGDMDINFPLLSDDSYTYFLEKNSNNITRASLDAARSILLILAQRGSESVDIFSVTGGHKSAEQYRLALQLFIKSPELNPVMTSAVIYAGGISKSDMAANNSNIDTNYVSTQKDNSKHIDSLINPFIVR
jgi:hypothetical protein